MEAEVGGGAVGSDSSRCQGQRLSEGVLVLGVQRGVIETRNRISQVFKQFKELKPLKGQRWRGVGGGKGGGAPTVRTIERLLHLLGRHRYPPAALNVA